MTVNLLQNLKFINNTHHAAMDVTLIDNFYLDSKLHFNTRLRLYTAVLHSEIYYYHDVENHVVFITITQKPVRSIYCTPLPHM